MNDEAKKGIKSGIQSGVKNFAFPAIDLLVAAKPEWAISWMVAKGFFGVLFDYQQEKINWFVEYLNKNKGVFVNDILKTDEFQEGFVITFENYIKQRGEKRRKIIEQIFLDFTREVDKDSFELERLYRTTELISLDLIKFLGFINSKVWPTLISDIHDNSAHKIKLTELLGDFFRIDDNHQKFAIYYQNYIEYMAELNTLGLITIKGSKTITYAGETNILYGFTDFGFKFITYIANI